jgi:hypothetical protein
VRSAIIASTGGDRAVPDATDSLGDVLDQMFARTAKEKTAAAADMDNALWLGRSAPSMMTSRGGPKPVGHLPVWKHLTLSRVDGIPDMRF